MLEPGPFTTLLGGAELLGGGQLQDPRPDQGGKSAVSTLTHLITDVMSDVNMMTPLQCQVMFVMCAWSGLCHAGVYAVKLWASHTLHSYSFTLNKWVHTSIIKNI